MNCHNCEFCREVQWGKQIKMACMNGLFGRYLESNPVDGEQLAIALSNNWKDIFERVNENRNCVEIKPGLVEDWWFSGKRVPQAK